jgi:hypothetical protein
MAGILPDLFRLFSVQHNGQFVFVSNDTEGRDYVVEAHTSPDEERNYFRSESADDNDPTVIRLVHDYSGLYVFVSNDDDAGDNIVEAHADDEFRNTFVVQHVADTDTPFGRGGVYTFHNTQYGRFLFLSNTKKGGDFVIEAHPSDELRNQFVVLPG